MGQMNYKAKQEKIKLRLWRTQNFYIKFKNN